MICKLILQSKAPYLTAQERAEIESYLSTVKARRAALEEVRRNVGKIVERTVARIRTMYPQMARFHQNGYEKTQRDLGMITNLTANAMFLGEHETLDEMFTEWFRTIMKAVHLTPQLLKDSYGFWIDEMKAALSEECFALMRPHAEHVADYLTRIPVPARDEVGERVPVSSLPGAESWKF